MTFEKYIEGMTTRDLVAQLLCPALRATYKEDSDPREYFENVFKDTDVKPGAFYMFPSKKEDITNLTKMLKEYCGNYPLFATDMETSPVFINDGGSNFGSAMVISAANSEEDAYTAGESCAKEGFEVGVHWTFGPVYDMCLSAASTTNTRAWSNNPETTARMANAFVNGVQQNGAIATGKHFPSNDGTGDSHIHATFQTQSMEQWWETNGKAWQSAIDNGVRAIMPTHACFPAAEPDGRIIPCTLSYNVITKLLREKMGFKGLVVSDGFNMGGLVPYVRYDKAYVRAIQAGCDMLIFTNFCSPMTETVDILEKAVNDGEITIERIKESVYRIYKEKERLGLFDGDTKYSYKPVSTEDREKFSETSKRIGENSISIFKNEAGHLPLDEKKIKRIISVDLTNTERKRPTTFDDTLRARGIEVLKYGEYEENGIVSVEDLPKADALILNFYYGFVWGGLNMQPCGKMLQKVYEYLFKLDIPVIMICHGSPFIPCTFPYAKTVVNTFSMSVVNPEGLCDILFGKKEAKGVTPVELDLRQPDVI